MYKFITYYLVIVSKINSENKKLKRQSAMMFQKMQLASVDIDLDEGQDNESPQTQVETEYMQNLNQKIRGQ